MRSMIYREEVHVQDMVTVVRDELSTSHKLKNGSSQRKQGQSPEHTALLLGFSLACHYYGFVRVWLL